MKKIDTFTRVVKNIADAFTVKHEYTEISKDHYMFDVESYHGDTGKIEVEIDAGCVSVKARMDGFTMHHCIYTHKAINSMFTDLSRMCWEHHMIKRVREFMKDQDFSYADVQHWINLGDLKD